MCVPSDPLVCVCACVCTQRAADKLSVVLLNLSDRILMLIPMVNSPETVHRKLIRPWSIIYTTLAFGHTHKAENTVREGDSWWRVPDSYLRNAGSHREASRPEHSTSRRLHHSLNSRTTQKFYSAAASNISNPTALAFMYRVFRSFYAGGTLLRALQLAEFSEWGKSLRNEKHDHTVQISIYLHLVLVFSAAIPLTLPVAFSPSLCDHTLFFSFASQSKT